jgi:2-polyprenyl-3-methyl-5-hydroxy-6-metoxy-1,4-benzoquinol methylase
MSAPRARLADAGTPGLERPDTSDYEHGGTQKQAYSRGEVVEVACPLCGSREGAELSVERQVIGIKRCSACSLIYTSPRLRDPEHIYWGEREKYLTEARLIFRGKASHHRDPNYLEELELLETHHSKGRLLDVGCNMGMLLRLARERGWDAVGVEPSPALREIATEELGLPVYNSFVEDLPACEDGSFDVVALSDVFEHVTAPREFLAGVKRLLKHDGLLYVKVPNARWSILKQRLPSLLGRPPLENAWDSYEHVVHYTESTLRAMLGAAGYEPRVLTFSRPVQLPVWHRYVGQYFQYPSPWVLDWKRRSGRVAAYALARLEHRLRGEIGYLAPNLVALARVAG